ncbi:hypothetical protein B0H63DRAFT_520419 [Podospora didyma]|uniref:Uncharacterized protein n=1 Tax=Podospora didyma TaxID=330526 RepID=A0AAE0P0V0_9PEZI|nr:hypothetical protein B0H63DRAFT_520419 [Podospora didyma]
MSRNVRQKYPAQPVKPTKKRRDSNSDSNTDSSSLNLSDDTGYSGVEDVSESDNDDDEERMLAAESVHIATNEVARKRIFETPRPQTFEDDEGQDADEEEDDDDDDEHEEDDDNDDDEIELEIIPDDTGSWDGILSENEVEVSAEQAAYTLDQYAANVEIERHVRFAGVPDSDSDSTTSDTSEDVKDFFPDIFVDQSTLDPAFRREIELDEDSSNSGSFWDYNNSQDMQCNDSDDDLAGPAGYVVDEITPVATPMTSQAPTEASTPVASGEVQELDGYETDGDTTEEDTPEPVVRKKTKRPHSLQVSSDSDTERPTSRFRRGRPRIGQFNLDSRNKKPVAVVNHISRKLVIFTPQRENRLDLSPESFNVDFSAPDLTGCSPILSNPGYVMMGAMFSSNPFADYLNTQPYGPTEAFFPMTSDAITGEDSDESEIGVPQEDEEESMLKIEDFITFHHDSSDEEELEPTWDRDLATAASSPQRPRTAASGTSAVTDASVGDVHPLLSHFGNNSDAVGAFRRNQINQQLINSEQASQESLAFSGPYYHGTLRGIKTGSMETVTTPITPVRRQRRTNSLMNPITMNTANGASGINVLAEIQGSSPSVMSQKRKASNPLGDSMHKRHRSISDMEVLHIQS